MCVKFLSCCIVVLRRLVYGAGRNFVKMGYDGDSIY